MAETEKHCPVHAQDVTEHNADVSPTMGTAVPVTSENSGHQHPCSEPTTFQLVLVLAGLWVGVLLVSLGDTMLATISASISSSFGSVSDLSWIAATFLISSTVSVPLSGHLTDIYGRRKGLILCYALFAIGTLACGLSEHRLWLFLTGRVIQGLGGGALCSITSFIEADLVPLRKRALIEGLGNIAYGATLAVGGVFGGAIDETIGWKYAFLIQVPVIVIDAVLVILVLQVGRQKSSSSAIPRSIDWVGGGLLVLAIVFFQVGLNTGSTDGGWRAPLVIASLAVAGVGFTVFVFWDFARAPNPVLPIRIMLQRTIASSQLSFFLATAATFCILYYVPIYLQVLGCTTGESGLRFMPYAAAFAAGSFAAGFLIKVTGRYYLINVFVQLAAVLGAILLCTMSQRTHLWAPFVYLTLLGLGLGGGYVTRLMGVLISADDETQAVLQAASWTVESAGGSVGIAAGSAVFQKLSSSRLDVLLARQPEVRSQLQASFGALQDLAPSQREAVIGVYLKAVRGVLFLALACMILAAVTSFFMKNVRISDDTPLVDQEAVSEDALDGATQHRSGGGASPAVVPA